MLLLRTHFRLTSLPLFSVQHTGLFHHWFLLIISVRDKFRSGGLKSLARIFFPLLALKSSGFARILPDFLPENGYLNNCGKAAAPLSPMGRIYAYASNSS